MTAFRRPVASAEVLNPVELLEYTRFVAAEVAAQRYRYIEYHAEQRWHQRLYRDGRVDVWLISWLPTQGTQLHDHGGSAGAFTVLSGTLSEAVLRRSSLPTSGTLVEHSRSAGSGVGFGSRYVHDVRNLGDGPAVSVHAYSPPLTSMNFYDLDERGELVRLASLATDDPEPDTAQIVPGSTGASSAA